MRYGTIRLHRSRPIRGVRYSQRGSVLLVSIVLITVAGIAALAWLNFIHNAQRAAQRDRDRMTAFYAAEAGVEQVVDYLNTPTHYIGDTPENYDDESKQPSNYSLLDPSVAPSWYPVFEPYIVSYGVDDKLQPVYKDGKLVTTRTTFFQNLNAGSAQEISKTSKIPTCILDISGNDSLLFNNDDGNEMARVKEIRIVHPTDIEKIEGSLPNDLRVITKVVATGITPSGVEVQLESLITENPTYELRSPGAIISNSSVTYAGNFNVHWGEVWAAEDIDLPTNFLQKIPRYDAATDYDSKNNLDRWFKLRSEKWVKDSKGSDFADGRVESGFSSSAPASSSVAYKVPYDPSILYVPSKGKKVSPFVGLQNIEQHQHLDFPDYNYADWKAFVISYGFPYYFTDTDGTIYGTDTDPSSDTYGKTVGRSYSEWFGTEPDAPEYHEITKMIVFVDTVPTNDGGQAAPKNADGVPIINSQYYPRDPVYSDGLMATIKLAGGGLHTRGAIFLAANLDMTGQGNPPSWQDIPDVLMPTGTRPPSSEKFDVFHNGLLYCWGSVSGGGNRTIYGSIFTETGYASNGDPQVFYNYRMKDGTWLNLNVSRVNRILWNYNSYDLSKL